MKTLTIGRDASNNIVLNDNMVSRNHAQLIVLGEGRVQIKDLGSTNGTFVNGNKINELYLNPGDIVKCANAFLNWQLYVNSTAPNSENRTSDKNNQPDQRSGQNIQREPVQNENKLFISASISDSLPAMVRNELATLSAQRQQEFVEEYNRKKKSLALAYFLMLPLCFCLYYGYLHKWGLQFLFWFTAGGLGIWWIIDLFRQPGLIKDYNMDIANEVMRNLKTISHS
ncbi:MAG: FHA domain-containing protein [Lentimicrobiaceae bacterium]|jgi:hypothetical protein